MRIAICDDDAEVLKHLTALLQEYQSSQSAQLTLRSFQSATNLLWGMRGGEYDVVLLDVVMPGLGGIQAAHELRALDKTVRIIFLTSSPEFAVESYAVGAYHYLLKPATTTALFPLLNKVRTELNVLEEEVLLLKGRDGLVSVPISRLEYVEVMNKTVFFHLDDGSVRELNAPLADVEETLLSHPEFLKVHRAYLLNLRRVQSVGTKGAITKAGQFVPVARPMYAAVRDTYSRILSLPQSEALAMTAAPAQKDGGRPEAPWQILLVDDEPGDLAAWSARLRERGCIVETAKTGMEALTLCASTSFDCVLLDVVLSNEDGFDLCARLRKQTSAPVIFLSCLTDTEKQLQGFSAGGIDYITKDAPVDLFWTKVETRIRLSGAARTQLSFAPLLLDISRRKVTLDGAELVLTSSEFDLIWLLAEHTPRVHTPEELYAAILGTQTWDGGQAVQVHMSRLRRKLEKAYPQHCFLETVWGQGYRFVPVGTHF